ncbi:MFS transporter [Tessaracoccus flavus]|uniref:Uncharacterized protein n=1 Tax=Tessaracoccus flavus TaxID=1610493 RepID=A0A1Q2CFV9_9ACTN|nr:MFS transporter [Tessaracoccus flavus]AQP44999.1 hypothetical protein RPIT_09545 [Tessaracoccus flavus]SDY59680.1 Predicted arabinose efflux permease, MFS family [Tessaracoccus flavus]
MEAGRRVLIAGIMLSVFAIAFQTIGIATALPTIMGYFETPHLYPWAFTTFVSGMLVATIAAGRVADLKGPAGPMYAGFGLFVAGLVVGSLAPNVWVLLVARLIQGLGAGALNLTLSVTVAHGFDGRSRPKVMALISFCWLLPAFIGPPVAAALTRIDWRLVFALMLPLVFVSVAITRPGLRRVQADFEPDTDEVPRIAAWPTAAVAMAPSLILLAGQKLGWVSVASGVAGVALLVWGVPRILAPRTRGLGPGIPSVVLTRALQAGSFFAAETILLVTLQDLRGLTPFDVGLALTVGSVGWTLGSWLQSQGWVRLTRDAFITLGAIASSTGIAVIVVFAWVPSIHLFVGLLGWVISGLGMGLTMPSSAVAVMALSTQFEQGRHQSSMQVAESIGNAVITAVAGGLYTALLAAEPQKLSYTTALSATLVLSLAAVVLSRRIGRIANELHA